MKKKLLSASAVVVLTTAVMLFVGSTGLAFGECGNPEPLCYPGLKRVVHSELATKFINYFGLTWQQGPPNDPICHPPCGDAVKKAAAAPGANGKLGGQSQSAKPAHGSTVSSR